MVQSVEGRKIIMAAFLAIFGCGILVAGLALPPLGKIDNSVLVAAGEVFVFSGAIMGINLNYNLRLQEMKREKNADGNSNN